MGDGSRKVPPLGFNVGQRVCLPPLLTPEDEHFELKNGGLVEMIFLLKVRPTKPSAETWIFIGMYASFILS